MSLTRRDIIARAGAGLAASALGAVALPAVRSGHDPDLITTKLVQLFANRSSAEAIGRAYLRGLDAPRPDLAVLQAELMRALQLDPADLHPQRATMLETRLRERIRQNFAEGSVVMVDGWILSRIEVQACAIACLGTAATGTGKVS